MSKTIILNRPLSEAEIADISRMAEGEAQVFAVSGGHAPEFAKSIRLSSDEKREVNYQTMEEILLFGDVLLDGRTVADLFRIDNASVWHYHKFRVYFAVRNLMYFVRPLEKHFSNFDDHIWYVSPETKPLKSIFPNVDFRFPVNKSKNRFNFGHLFSYLLLIKYRFFRYLFSAKKQPEYLLYLVEKYSTVLNKKTLLPDSGHHILEYLISGLDDRFALLTEVLMPKPKGKSDYSYCKAAVSVGMEPLSEGFSGRGIDFRDTEKQYPKVSQYCASNLAESISTGSAGRTFDHTKTGAGGFPVTR